MEEFEYTDDYGDTLSVEARPGGVEFWAATPTGMDSVGVVLPKDRAAELGRLLIKWAGVE